MAPNEGTGAQGPTLTPVVPGDAPPAAVPAAPAHVRTPSRRALVAALVVWAAAVAVITLRPAAQYDGQVDLVRQVTDWLVAHGVPLTFALVEALANVAMFVPLGVLLVLLAAPADRRAPAARRLVVRITLVSAAVSTGIEVAQALWLPSRVPTVQDVVMNTAGAAAGAIATLVVLRRRERTPS